MILRIKIMLITFSFISSASFGQKLSWTDDGLAFTRIKEWNLKSYDLILKHVKRKGEAG